jgi:DNA-binding transcriptional MerR regulator
MNNFYKEVSYLGAKNSASKIILFLRRFNINLHSGSIRHYLSAGVLPKPENGGRLYSKKHIAFLTIIGLLSEIFTLTRIKEIFETLDFYELDETNTLLAAQNVLEVFENAAQTEKDTPELILAAKSAAYFKLAAQNKF